MWILNDFDHCTYCYCCNVDKITWFVQYLTLHLCNTFNLFNLQRMNLVLPTSRNHARIVQQIPMTMSLSTKRPKVWTCLNQMDVADVAQEAQEHLMPYFSTQHKYLRYLAIVFQIFWPWGDCQCNDSILWWNVMNCETAAVCSVPDSALVSAWARCWHQHKSPRRSWHPWGRGGPWHAPTLRISRIRYSNRQSTKHQSTWSSMKQQACQILPNSCQILAKFLPSFAALLYDSHESDPGLQALVATRWMTCWNTCCTDQSTRVLCSSICSKRPGNSLITKSHEIIKARNLSSHRHSTRGTCQNPRPMFPQLIIMCVCVYMYIYIYIHTHTHDTHNIYMICYINIVMCIYI